MFTREFRNHRSIRPHRNLVGHTWGHRVSTHGQSPSVSATRKPVLKKCCAVRIGERMADRTMSELEEKLPPRMTPISQFPGRENADPSTGISSGLGVQQSSTHSQALPCISKMPRGLGLKLPTGAAP